MGHSRRRGGVLTVLVFILLLGSVSWTESQNRPPGDSTKNLRPQSPISPAPHSTAKEPYVSIDQVVLIPYRSANVGSVVSGVIEHFYYDRGDLIKKGQVIVLIDPERYRLIALRAEERLRAAEAALKLAEEEAKLKGELLQLDAATRQDTARKKAAAEIARYKVAEAEREMDLARYDLVNCRIKAPFSGYLTVRYKQPDEPVEPMEKVFTVVDTSRVYAVANVPEILVSEFKKGTEAEFVLRPDARFPGKVARVGKMINPNSRTKKVYLLLDNADSQLEVGMTGSLNLMK